MRILLSVLIIFVFLPANSSTTSISGVVNSLWKKFWSSSCEFSSDVSRSRRSINEFPNTQDPDEFFEYLYPSLHLTHEDIASGRSFHFTSWFDDLIEYWETECHSSSDVSSRDDKETLDYGSEKDSNSSSTTAPSLNVSLLKSKEGQVGENVTIASNTTDLLKDVKQLPSPESPLSDLVAAIFPTPPALNLNRKPINTFFAQYGGDFEYFFPVWGFGIPFDGEITFLGFHGFKGLFPYRR